MKSLSLLALCAALAIPANTRASDALTTMCHDPERGIVQRTTPATCNGIMVTDAEAREISAYYVKKRAAQVERRVQDQVRTALNPMRFERAGTAFAVNSNGALITNRHVVSGCDALEVHPTFGQSIQGSVVAEDAVLDLAVIQSNHTPRQVARFVATDFPDRTPLAMIGFPKTGMIRIDPKLTPVWTSGEARPDGLLGVYGDVRSGNSGGAVFDSRGRVAAVVRSKVDSVAAAKALGRTVTQVGALVTSRAVMGFLERARTPYKIDGTGGVELSGREIFDNGRAMSYRIDCMVRR